MKYRVVTFGCQMNKSDSERIAARLESEGHKNSPKLSGADLIVVNMCSVRQSAVDRIFGLAQKLKTLRGAKRLKIILTGCVLKKDKMKFREIFDEIWQRPEKQNTPSKFIPISNGCNNFCSYCVVPYTRGRLVCRGHEEILKEIKKAVKNGVKEIWLLGQNVNDYRSAADPRIDFAQLLKMTNNTPGDFRIRFTSPNPKNFDGRLIESMVKCQKVSRYLNLPVQSGDDEILKKMNRPYTAGQYKKLVKQIREAMPDINLSTDAIVGFPGETKKQFENTAKLFKEIKFNIAYIAKYSPRPGTAAFLMKDSVTVKEKKRREKILMGLLKKSACLPAGRQNKKEAKLP